MPTATQNATTSKASSTRVDRAATKARARADLLRAHGWTRAKRLPIAALITAGADPALLTSLRDGFGHLQIHLFELPNTKAAELAGCDMAIFADTGLAHGRAALTALTVGTVPIVYEQSAPKDKAIDYDPTDEQGNSFYFYDASAWAVFAAVIRATEAYRFSYDWAGIVRNTSK